jgi:hypothetical protein
MRRFLATCAIVVPILLAAGCGGSDSDGEPASSATTGTSTSPAAAAPTAPADEAAAAAEVKKNWTAFFFYKTPRAKQISLLENGDQLGPAIKFAARLQAKQSLEQNVKVKEVSFTSEEHATVQYALRNGTTELLPAAQGDAVLVDGTWKVSQATFCTLVELGNGSKPVPSCS